MNNDKLPKRAQPQAPTRAQASRRSRATPLPPTTDLEVLLTTLDGEYFDYRHPGWDTARQAWNLHVDQHPYAVVQPESARDVVAVVRAAGRLGLHVAAQGTGHNAAPLGDLSDTILVRTDRLDDIEIDVNTMSARVGAGALWGAVTAKAAESGLAALAGSSPDVGVIGYTLGGGLSWLARSHGLAANSVTEIELVTPRGEIRRVHAASGAEIDQDLFWALRGGGGDFGIVTELIFRLYPITEVFAGTYFWPIDQAAEVFHAWCDWTKTVPASVTSAARLLRVPPLPEIPEFLRGNAFVTIEAVFQDTPEKAREMLGSLSALEPVIDTFATVPIERLGELHMDPPGPVPSVGDGMLISSIDHAFVDAFVRSAGHENPAAQALLSVEVRHLGGELASDRGEGGAVNGFDAEGVLYAVGMAPVPELAGAVQGAIDQLEGSLALWRDEREFLSFSERPRDPETLFGSNLGRLRDLKDAVDPAGILRSNHPARGPR